MVLSLLCFEKGMINMENNYKPNSHRSKETTKESNTERQKLEKVVSGTAKVKKKSPTRKFADVFISEDVSNVKTYIVSDVLIPAAKKLIFDTIRDGMEMLLYGGTTRGERRSGYRADYVSYNRFSEPRGSRKTSGETRTRTGYSYNDIFLDSRAEAEEVLARMDEAIDMYGIVSVADLYDLIGEPHNYTDNKYGWTNIRNAEAVRTRDGYLLKFPKALPID